MKKIGRVKNKPLPLNQMGDVIKDKKLGSGEWVVMATRKSGGGRAHNDVYPDGHELVLMKLRKGTDDVDWESDVKYFYQSGCFTENVMLCNPKLKRKLIK